MQDDLPGAPLGVAAHDAVSIEDTAYPTSDQPIIDETFEAEEAAPADEAEDDYGEAHRAPRRSAQQRIDEITRSRREAERERDYWREQALAIAQGPDEEVEAYQAFDPHAEPDPRAFEHGAHDPDYIRALGAHSARAAFEEMAEAAFAEQAQAQIEQDWAQRQEAFAARQAPDYFDALHGSDWPCSEAMAEAIRSADDGAAVAYHLATHPEEAHRIAGLNSLAQIREIGRLEARLGPAGQAGFSPFHTISQAPAPPAQIRGGGGRYRISPDTDDFAAFDQAYG